MANRKITDLPELTSLNNADINLIIDVSDTSESAQGTSKKISWTNVKAFLKTYFDTLYTTTSAVASQITTALTGYATQTWVTAQGYITNVVSALGYTPANKAGETFTGAISATNLSGTNTGDQDLSGLQPKGQPVTETGTSFSLTDAHNGKITILTASCTVTIPNGLVAGFEHTIVTLAGVTLTVALGGSVTLFNNAGTTMAEKLSCTIKNRTATNQYITAGNL